jgi:hypothetical protein
MIFLLDTNAIADLMNQHPTFAARLAAVAAEDQCDGHQPGRRFAESHCSQRD